MRLLLLVVLALLFCIGVAGATKVTLDQNGVFQVDGRKEFVLSFSIPLPPGGKTPNGGDAYAELARGGANFFRVATGKEQLHGSVEGLSYIESCLDSAAAHRQRCWITLGPITAIKSEDTRMRSFSARLSNVSKTIPASVPGKDRVRRHPEPRAER